ncbi:hypothetical protein D3C80_2125990 [compost metagenome]
MSLTFELRASLKQNIEAFGRDKPADCYELGNLVIMWDWLEPFLVETIRNDSDLVRALHVGR